ncbi:hypothetical protein GCM10008090_00380 [Arenicella chitinivorans]|uniref:Uncharacterized protein n=1 Tax=Arenicella chitinivorans TaxID=1329800 RepID=A0A918RG75_9GAMM|nr:hypothetical protein GCM10008090_00380 [Arenicella chitinivorans]
MQLFVLTLSIGFTKPAYAAEYQLRVESKEAAKGYVSLQIFRKRKSCLKAITEHQPKYPGRELVCVKLTNR